MNLEQLIDRFPADVQSIDRKSGFPDNTIHSIQYSLQQSPAGKCGRDRIAFVISFRILFLPIVSSRIPRNGVHTQKFHITVNWLINKRPKTSRHCSLCCVKRTSFFVAILTIHHRLPSSSLLLPFSLPRRSSGFFPPVRFLDFSCVNDVSCL